MKKFLFGLLLVIGAIFAALVFARTPETDPQLMRQKYANSASKFLTTPTGTIHYRDEGVKTAPVLVLIHGSNSSLHTWEKLVDLLDEKYRLISIDLPGHGLTGPNNQRDYSAKTTINSVTSVLDALNVPSATWVGNSMGGWIVWRAALEVPNRVNAIVLVDASGAQTAEKIKPYLGARLAQNPLGRLALKNYSPKFLVKSSLEDTIADPSKLSDATIDRYWELLLYPGNRQAVLDRALTPREDDVFKTIGSIKVPTLIIWGDKDSVIPQSHGAAFNKEIKGSKLSIIKDAGHLPMEETPAEFANILDLWLAQSAQ